MILFKTTGFIFMILTPCEVLFPAGQSPPAARREMQEKSPDLAPRGEKFGKYAFLLAINSEG
jgi:hypothetical protein